MSISLSPATAAKLSQFDRRRRHLLWLRGTCAALVTLTLLMSAIAALDWFWVLNDTLRWSLSLVGYGGVLLAVWVTALRRPFRAPSRQDLALGMERAEPRLRERLLAAIELSVDAEEEVHDSATFRQLLQDQVGQQIAQVQVPKLLPVRLLSRWLLAALALVVGCVLLLSWPELPFRQLLVRALLPGANIGRVSRIQVEILQPAPPSLTVPQHETVAIVAAITGGEVRDAVVELRAESGMSRRQPLRAQGATQQVANIDVGTESLEYRILAGDAVTRWYAIQARPRPAVLEFEKTYRYPPYAGLDERHVRETHGDLVALAGTEVQLDLHLDQDVSDAEMRLQLSTEDAPQAMTLERLGPRLYRTTVKLVEAGIYKIHLVSSETGFDNPFSPKFEIRPEPDLIPRVGFVDQPVTTLLLPPNDVLPLAGLAEDDLPLVSLAQYVSVNGRAWQVTPLEIEPRTSVSVRWDWDLLNLDLKQGDQVSTKLVATDRKGNIGESIPLQIVVTATDFDPQRHVTAEHKRQLLDRLEQLAALVAEQQRALTPWSADTEPSEPPVPLDDTVRNNVSELADRIRDGASGVYREVLPVLPEIARGVDGQEVETVGRVLARIEQNDVGEIRAGLLMWQEASNGEQVKAARQQVQEAIARCTTETRALADRFQIATAHNILAAIAMDLDGMNQHQQRVLGSTALQSWPRLLRQQTVTLTYIRDVERRIRKQREYLPGSMQNSLLQVLDWLATARDQLEQASESEDQLPQLRRAAERFQETLQRQRNAIPLHGGLPAKLVKARQGLVEQAGQLHDIVKQLAKTTGTRDQRGQALGQANDSGEIARLEHEIQQQDNVLAQVLGPGMAAFNARRDLAQSRRDADQRYAADVGLTRRAVVGLLAEWNVANASRADSEARAAARSVPGILDTIAAAYRVLEAGHEVLQLRIALHDLLLFEQWESLTIAARNDAPRQWDALQAAVTRAVGELRSAGYPGDLCSDCERFRWYEPVQRAGRKIGSRRYALEGPVSAAHDLLEYEADLVMSVQRIEPIMAEARAVIAQYVPSIADLAAHAAHQVRELETATNQLADEVSAAERVAATPEMNSLQQRQQEVDRQLESLSETLVEDANSQDLLQDAGRERARDADDSLAVIQEAAEGMEQTLQQAAAANQVPQQTRELAQAAEQQERSAQSLEQIAEHYRRLEAGEDVAQTRQALRTTERESGTARQLDNQYDEAQRLGELARKDPQQLLAELESQLAEKPAMRQSLSEIARNTLEQARNALQDSTAQERQVREANERSDPKFQAQKQQLIEQLREVGRQAAVLSRTLVPQAEAAAASGRAEQARDELREANHALSEAGSQAGRVDENWTLADTLQAARDVADSLDNAHRDLSEAKPLTATAQQQNLHENDAARNAARNQMETQQKQYHDQVVREAKEGARTLRQQEKQRQQNVRNAERQARTVDNQVNQARRTLQRSPDNESARNALRDAERRQQEAARTVAAAQQLQQAAAERADQADQVAKQLEQRKLPPLEAPNPAGQLADRLAEQALTAAQALAEQARQLAGKPAWEDTLQPTAGQLQQAARQQDTVQREVNAVAEDVARASRHERRLGQPENSQQLEATAQDIQHVAENEVASAGQQLAQAAPEPASGTNPAPERGPAQAAHEAVRVAQEALAAQAEALNNALDSAEAAAEGAPAATGDPATGEPVAGEPAAEPAGSAQAAIPTPAEAAEGQMLARMLDELDRAAAATAADPASSGPPAPAANPSGLTRAARDESARLARARLQMQAARQGPPSSQPTEEPGQGADVAGMADAVNRLPEVNRAENEQWGQLRGKSAEDLTEGRRERVAAEYQQQVQTYFRVIAERARLQDRSSTPAGDRK